MNKKINQSIASQVMLAENIFQSGNFSECIDFCEKTLIKYPSSLALLDLCALSYLQVGLQDDAIDCYERVIQANPNQLTANLNLGKLHITKENYDLALPYLQKSSYLDEKNEEVNFLFGSYFEAKKNYPEAINSYSKVIAKNPENHLCYIRIALILNQLNHNQAAIEALDYGIKNNHDNLDLLYCKALILEKSGTYTAASTIFEELALKSPRKIEYIFGYAEILKKTNKITESEEYYKAAIALDPNHIPSMINYGNLLCHLKRLDEGQRNFETVLNIEPTNDQALSNLASLMMIKRDLVQAWKYYELAYKSNLSIAGSYLYSMAFQCEWKCYGEVAKALKNDHSHVMSSPFPAVIFCTSAESHLVYAEKYAKNIDRTGILGPALAYEGHTKIRVGYYSSDFYNHATMMLMEGMLKAHDRTLFEFHAFSLDHTRPDEHNKRARQLFDHYHDVHNLSDRAVALLSRNLEIDIAIDLKGYTEGSRTSIFAERAAPIQINYLGYPGSMGAPFIDYLIADSYIIPEEYRKFYSEKIIYMPDCYQPNNPERPFADSSLPRPKELPDDKFIFCCFNSTYKITPEIFEIWMQILNQAPDSILWLLKSTPRAEDNLKNYAKEHGVNPERLIFAEMVSEAENIQRLSHADLFLDTYPCNAHTTASDSLRAGVPLITISSETFASRVAGSILKTTGLAELITTNKEDYSKLAMQIYNNKHHLNHLKELVKSGISTGPLYDIEKYTRNFETALFNVQKYAHHSDKKNDVYI